MSWHHSDYINIAVAAGTLALALLAYLQIRESKKVFLIQKYEESYHLLYQIREGIRQHHCIINKRLELLDGSNSSETLNKRFTTLKINYQSFLDKNELTESLLEELESYKDKVGTLNQEQNRNIGPIMKVTCPPKDIDKLLAHLKKSEELIDQLIEYYPKKIRKL